MTYDPLDTLHSGCWSIYLSSFSRPGDVASSTCLPQSYRDHRTASKGYGSKVAKIQYVLNPGEGAPPRSASRLEDLGLSYETLEQRIDRCRPKHTGDTETELMAPLLKGSSRVAPGDRPPKPVACSSAFFKLCESQFLLLILLG